MGKKKQASYRVVVADQDSPRDGAFVEIVGHYNPRTDPMTVEFNAERVKHRLLFAQGITTAEPPKRQTKPTKAEAAAAKAAAEAAAAPAAE
jgi:ribosomal protein S16